MAQEGIPDRGILAIDKERGPTSHDVVARLRRLLGMRKVGHCGTLDPLATGVLVTCFGRYTRLADWIAAGDKEYEATFVLGVDSDTGDAEGPLRPRPVPSPPGRHQVEEALGELRGPLEQVPPAHSAVKVGGVPSYRLARRNRAVALKPRRVHVHRLDLVCFAYPSVEVRVVCSKGTYIRSLAADLGRRLGCGAYVSRLRRRRVGAVDLEAAQRLDIVASCLGCGGLSGLLTPPERALRHLGAAVRLDPGQACAFVHGGQVEIGGEAGADPTAVLGPGGALLGLARRRADGLKSLCVVGEAGDA